MNKIYVLTVFDGDFLHDLFLFSTVEKAREKRRALIEKFCCEEGYDLIKKMDGSKILLRRKLEELEELARKVREENDEYWLEYGNFCWEIAERAIDED